MYQGGDCPPDENFAATVCSYVQEWLDDRANGMDVLASVDIDNAIELLEAMREVL